MDAPSSQADAKSNSTDPVYQKNPHPTQAYRITLTIEDAPGPFDWISGTAFYQMTNHKQCTPIEPIAGVWSKSDEDGIPIRFEKRDASTYVATIYADGMVDADYYSKGVCKFELDGVGISLRATGDNNETRFQPALFKDEIHSSTPKVTYFWKGRYPKADMENFPDGGETSKDQFNDTAKNNLFKVTLAVEEVNP
ncbi:hypothetical protein ACFFJ4_22850 [Xanthomonas dyei]|uniref:Uncharacterized protein n=1 Tax=Xanthomonas dyei TaxID=743699 RepID=A0A2S7BFP2_9XANT|nr:hypothetical protein [Xanthomonas dyei]PPU44051.1 hypothetical protein XdyCFBP7245_23100 [Xanthomonas dyei]